jgi:hypothetical protein
MSTVTASSDLRMAAGNKSAGALAIGLLALAALSAATDLTNALHRIAASMQILLGGVPELLLVAVIALLPTITIVAVLRIAQVSTLSVSGRRIAPIATKPRRGLRAMTSTFSI